MRGPSVELPESARTRLSELELARDSAQDAIRSAQNRMNMLPASAGKLHGRLEIERDKFAEKHRLTSLLVHKINEWRTGLRLVGSVLAAAPPVDIRLKPDETLPDAITDVRREIGLLKQQIANTRAAPLKIGDKKTLLLGHLAGLALRVKPRLAFDQRGNDVRINWAEDLIVDKNDLLGVLMFFFGYEQILAAFDLDKPDAPGALSPLEKEQQVSKLANNLLALERKEEYLIERGAADGVEILRRPDANPLAVLNLAIVAAQAQAAVA
jgi:hypothetical protein